MSFEIKYHHEAVKDLQKLDGSQRKLVLKAILKVATNPYPKNEGGFGKPLGNKSSNNLKNYLEIKLRKEGIRVIYSIVREKNNMYIIVIGARSDDEVYNIASKRIK